MFDYSGLRSLLQGGGRGVKIGQQRQHRKVCWEGNVLLFSSVLCNVKKRFQPWRLAWAEKRSQMESPKQQNPSRDLRQSYLKVSGSWSLKLRPWKSLFHCQVRCFPPTLAPWVWAPLRPCLRSNLWAAMTISPVWMRPSTMEFLIICMK